MEKAHGVNTPEFWAEFCSSPHLKIKPVAEMKIQKSTTKAN